MKQLPALKQRSSLWNSTFAFVASFVLLFALSFVPVQGATVEALQQEIKERNEQLATLEAEIARYEEELTKIGADRQTLEAEIARLDTSRKKIATDIAVTENRIATTDLELEELGNEIENKERRIDGSRAAIKQSLQSIAKLDDGTFIESFLASSGLSEIWEDSDQLKRVHGALSNEVTLLAATRNALIDDYTIVAKKQGQLVSFKKELSGQKSVLDNSRTTQNNILSQTKNKESDYQQLLEERREAQKQLEAEIKSFEAEIQYTLDSSSIPSPGSGILSFPFEPSVMQRCAERENIFGNLYCLTQYFGNTKFAQSGAYNGQGHNGIDFGVPEGTKVVSALPGVVVETGDTDKIIKGSKVKVTFGTVNVRSTPNGSILGTQSRGKTGIITDGPTAAGSYNWWKVNFNQGKDGWVADVALNNTCFSYGVWALVRHANGLATLYAHMSVASVNVGEAVAKGGLVGYSGNTGYSTGPHLHLTAYVADQVRVVRLGDVKPSTNCPAARIPVAPTEAYLNPLSYL